MTVPISGHTRLFGIVADPIAQVKTPQGLNALMAQAGFDGVMVPFHVPAEGLAAVLDGFRRMANFGGFIATVPHKTRMVALCDSVSNRARAIGAANAVRRDTDGRLVADMLDGDGFLAGLRQHGVVVRDQAVLLAGAGGAANAIAFALAEAGIARLTIANRTTARAEDLRARLALAFPALPVELGPADPTGHALVVNATSLGMRDGDPLPLDVTRLAPAMTVAEVIMVPATTPLLAAAAARGCRVHGGAPMLAGQLALMARYLRMTAQDA